MSGIFNLSFPVLDHNISVPQVDYNIKALMTRRKGEKFYVDEDGLLQKLTGVQKILYGTNRNYRTEVQGNVRLTISNTIKQLDPNNIPTDGKINSRFFEELFFDNISALSLRIFDRRLMEELDRDILKLIAPNFLDAREKIGFDTLEINDEVLTTNNDYFAYAVATADFALKLGIAPKPVKEGANGTYFLKDLSGKNIGVFKPKDEETLAAQAPKRRSRFIRLTHRILPFATAAFCYNGNACKAETAASIVSQQLGLNNVPTTRLASFTHPAFNYSSDAHNEIELPPKEGSFQLFIQTPHIQADEYFKIGINWNVYKLFGIAHKRLKGNIDQSEFEKLVILDFIIGNIDRHFANWLITQMNKILCIDNGFAMAHKHTDSISSVHQYEWKLLINAEKSFSDEAKGYINKLSIEQETLIAELRRHDLINEAQERTLRERIAVLIKFANEGKTMRQLGEVIKTQQFQVILGIARD